MSQLTTILRYRHVDALLSDAETIRMWPEEYERVNAATRFIQQAMYEQAIGRITTVELEQLTRLLSFAVDPVAPPLEDLWPELLRP